MKLPFCVVGLVLVLLSGDWEVNVLVSEVKQREKGSKKRVRFCRLIGKTD